jgi:hypothetical protein
MVTHEEPRQAVAGRSVDLPGYWSIVLAVAQWRRSPHVTSAAIARLRGLGIADAEIYARRRASSADPALAALLRLAVTVVIARGKLTRADRRFVERHSLANVLAQVEIYVADALAFVAAIETPAFPRRPEIEMDVGDY